MNPLQYLSSLELHGIKLGLQNTQHLLEQAGHPQNHYPTVHVAGTNGKGSVIAFLDAILRKAGYRVGRFTSPHLIRLNERFQINAKPIPDAQLQEHISFFQQAAQSLPSTPTFFELNTVVAFRYFSTSNVDIALIEVGMGGRFDATNVLKPTVTAITNIDLEHTAYLGDTLEKIAFEKAGILKHNRPLVLSELRAQPQKVILQRAAELACPVHLLNREFRHDLNADPLHQTFSYQGARMSIGPLSLPLAGKHQGTNAATALAIAECLQPAFPRLTIKTLTEGLSHTKWPGRLERVLEDPPVIIDAAHNPAGAKCIAQSLPPSIIVLALAADKDPRKIIEALRPLTHTLILTQFDGTRALPLTQLCTAAEGHPFQAIEQLDQAITLGMSLAKPDIPLLITGSIFAAGQARQILMKNCSAPAPVF